MNTRTRILVAALAAALALPAGARDTHRLFSIEKALRTPAARERLDRRVRLVFGRSAPGAEIGTWTSNKKTSGVGKTDEQACQWAFLSAAIALQNRALKEGGDAVVDIRSVYKNAETVSETDYVCGAGNVVAGVALQGTVVRTR
jgi:uncharacterized protein YbjQ (UPF0145 family)